MFERYTERARRVIFFGRQEASIFGSMSVAGYLLDAGSAIYDGRFACRDHRSRTHSAFDWRAENGLSRARRVRNEHSEPGSRRIAQIGDFGKIRQDLGGRWARNTLFGARGA